MRVLDIGCGDGDISRFVAGLVGREGAVVGIDRNEAALATARAHGADKNAATIEYRISDLANVSPSLGQFDAIVGRRVLMYLPAAADTLAQLVALAKPDAIFAFQEHARTRLPAGLGDLPLHRELYDLMWSTVAAESGDVGLALRLTQLMQTAGLIIEQARSEGILLHPEEPSFLPTLIRSMLPRMVERSVVNVEELDLDTLAERLEEERRAANAIIVWDLAFLVSARAKSSH